MNICIGVFAHNEELKIDSFIKNISEQSIFKRPDLNVTAYILANGCSDKTEDRAEAAIRSLAHINQGVLNLCRISESGKSRTWNLFVHQIAPNATDYFVFVDADIFIPEADTLERMYELMAASELRVFNSRPVKDLTFKNRSLSLTEKIILKSSGKLDSHKTAICGQLYMARSDAMRDIYLPIGLPVEDGFIRAMMLTDMLVNQEALDRISGADDIFHVYESIATIGELFRHQTRIVIGSAINEAVFGFMREKEAGKESRQDMLKSASFEEGWLNGVLKIQLPKWPYGFVSFNYLTKRLAAFRDGGSRSFGALVLMAVGFTFDLVVYLMASIKMWRGYGAGYW